MLNLFNFLDLITNQDTCSKDTSPKINTPSTSPGRSNSPTREKIEKREGRRFIFVGSICRAPFLGGKIPFFKKYHHESIYIGGDRIVEALGNEQQIDAAISKVSFIDLDVNMIMKLADDLPPFNGGVHENNLTEEVYDGYGQHSEEIAKLAKCYVGYGWTYHPTRNNCQHFTSMCQKKGFFSDETQYPEDPKDRVKEEVTLKTGDKRPRMYFKS